MKLHTKQLTLAALTAAAYAVLSYFGSIFGITYGPIQCRFSEALCVLPFFLPETAWGLGVGCLIANLLSPYGVLDIVVGSAHTAGRPADRPVPKEVAGPSAAGDRQHRAYRPGSGL